MTASGRLAPALISCRQNKHITKSRIKKSIKKWLNSAKIYSRIKKIYYQRVIEYFVNSKKKFGEKSTTEFVRIKCFFGASKMTQSLLIFIHDSKTLWRSTSLITKLVYFKWWRHLQSRNCNQNIKRKRNCKKSEVWTKTEMNFWLPHLFPLNWQVNQSRENNFDRILV